ncbi:HECT E3 ubiquitin ligase [Thraustotheca clavata]|uniref:HECT E3 ubiquitin ligase n=1 Tax=Thraustotheca clavata TaxID=74557 RepID=A0A1V9ZX98_9STRA|nr:HECT E3 ubiquitin ligase [Thraustotheca clavata]
MRKSVDAWNAAHLPQEVLHDGELLSQEYISLLVEESDADRDRILEAFGKLKAQRIAGPAPGTYSGDELDRLNLFVFPQQSESFKESFDAVTPSAVLRESTLTTMSSNSIADQLMRFQKAYCIKKNNQLLGRALVPDEILQEITSPYKITAHDPVVFPAKIFSMASTRFHLDMMQYFRKKEPMLFASGMQSVLSSILDCPPRSMVEIQTNTAEFAVFNSLVDFATAITSDSESSASDTWFALTLLLALGESTGRLHPLLAGLAYLLDNESFLASLSIYEAHEKQIKDVLERFESYDVRFQLDLLSDAAKRIRVLEDSTKSEDDENNDKTYSSIATDGKHLFAWSSTSGLVKIGSGHNGSAAGKIYAQKSSEELSIESGDVSVLVVADQLYLAILPSKTEANPVGEASKLLPIEKSTLTVGTATNLPAEHTSWFTDGFALYTASTIAASELVVNRISNLTDMNVDKTWQLSMATDAQAFYRRSSDVLYYTNGREIVASQHNGSGSMHSLHAILNSGKIEVGHHKADVDAKAISYDSTNNLVWAATSSHEEKWLHSYYNQGLKIANSQSSSDTSIDNTSLPLTDRFFIKLNSIVNAYVAKDSFEDTHIVNAVDLHEMTFKSLLTIITKSRSERYLEVPLKVLLINVQHWHHVKKPEAVGALVAQSDLGKILANLLESPPENKCLLESTQKLTVACLDLSHSTLNDQWKYLIELLQAAHANSLHKGHRATLGLIMDRLASHDKMQAFISSNLVNSTEWIELIHLTKINAESITESNDAFLVSISKKMTKLLVASALAIIGGYVNASISLDAFFKASQHILKAALTLTKVIDVDALEDSLVGQIVGLYVEHVNVILRDVRSPPLEDLEQLVITMSTLLENIKPMTTTLTSQNERKVSCIEAVKSMESIHPNPANAHESKEFVLPGATTMTITFDERSSTEGYYNSITFYTDESCVSYYGDERYYGNGDNKVWPGVGSVPPLFIPSNKCYIVFHTESNAGDYWGYRFDAKAKEERLVRSLHWLEALEESLLECLGDIAYHGLTTWSNIQPVETENSSVLLTDLFRGGLRHDAITTKPDQIQTFLDELIELPDESPAAEVARLLKSKTVQDQGSIPYINRAVRAVAAAILYHNGWAIDALALSQGIRNDPSTMLLKAWRNAQKMRHWFHLGDAQLKPVISEAKPVLKRQPSAYTGASDESLQVLCANVVERAQFLLTLSPGAEEQSMSKKRWGALAKFARSHRSGDDATMMQKWHALVDEAKAATDLKELIKYRKNAAGRDSHIKTMTELVLEFVQSDTSVRDMKTAVFLRNQRAHYRRLGLLALDSAVRDTSDKGAVVIESYSSSLQHTSSTVHLNWNLHGSDITIRQKVRESFKDIVSALPLLLKDDSTNTLFLTNALKLIALDFDSRDAELLIPDLLPLVFDLLLSTNAQIRSAAQSTVRLWCARFFTDISSLQPLLISLLQSYLEKVSAKLFPLDPVSTEIVHLPRIMLTMPLELITPDIFTLQFFIFHQELPIRQLKIGDRVKHGPNWSMSSDEALSIGDVGVVKKLDGSSAAVDWQPADGVVGEGAKTGQTKFFKYNETTQEIIPFDRDSSGLICSFEGATSEVCSLHINLTSQFEIRVGQEVVATSSVPLEKLSWQKITVLRQESSLQVMIDAEVILTHTIHEAAQNVVFGQTRLMHENAASAWVRFDEDESTVDGTPEATDIDIPLHALGVFMTVVPLSPSLLKPLSSLKDVLWMAFSEVSPLEVRVAAINVLTSLQDMSMVSAAFSTLPFEQKDLITYVRELLGHYMYPTKSTLPFQDAVWLVATLARFLRIYSERIDTLLLLEESIVDDLHRLTSYSTLAQDEVRQIISSVALLGGAHDGIFVGNTVQYKSLEDPKTVVKGIIVSLDSFGNTARVVPESDLTKLEYVQLEAIAADTTSSPPDVAKLYELLDASFVDELRQLLELRDDLPLWLLDIRVRLLKILPFMTEQVSMVASLMPQWLTLSQTPISGQVPPAKSNKIMYQSGHPYGMSIDAYQTVVVEGATSLRITFDERSRTEHDYDYIKFYKDDSYNDVWGQPSYTGRDGSENWPGFGGREPLEIPTNKFVLFWHTDPSGNDWGWLLHIEAVYSKNKTPSKPNWTLNQLEQRVFHYTDMMHQHQLSPSVTTKTLPAPVENTLPETWQEEMLYFTDEDDKKLVVVCPVNLYAEASNESDIIASDLAIGTTAKVIDSNGAWILVEALEHTGWCHLRNGDVFNFISPTESVSPAYTTMLECVKEPYVIGPVSGLLKTTDADINADDLETHFVPKGKPADKTLVPSALGDMLNNLASHYARVCLRAVCLKSVEDQTISANVYFELCDLFVFEKDIESPNPLFATQLTRLCHDETFRSNIIENTLRRLDGALAQLPKQSVNYVHIEKIPPLSQRRVYFPGASRLRVVFREDDTNVTNSDDSIRFYDTSGALLGQYTGAKDSGNWPGIGDVPPLVVEGNTLLVVNYVPSYFDTGTHAFKVYAEGFPTDVAPTTDVPETVEGTIRLACWILMVLAQNELLKFDDQVPMVKTLDLLFHVYQRLPPSNQVRVLDTLIALLRWKESAFVLFRGLSTYQVQRMHSFLHGKMGLRHEIDQHYGDDRSPLMQRLVQCNLEWDHQLQLYSNHIEELNNTFSNFVWDSIEGFTIIDGDRVELSIDTKTTVRATSFTNASVIAWDIIIHHLSSEVVVGIVGYENNEIAYGINSNGTLLPAESIQTTTFGENDVITLELNMDCNTLAVRRNQALLHRASITSGVQYYPAVSLQAVGDSVSITKRGPYNDLVAYNAVPEWYAASRKAMSMVNAFADFTPSTALTLKASSVDVPDSSKLQLVAYNASAWFAPMKITDPNGTTKIIEQEKLKAQKVYDDYLPLLTRVVRGYDWHYFDEDGGSGNIGVVLSMIPWNGCPNKAVKVMWLKSNAIGVYRYGYNGTFDVEPLNEQSSLDSFAVIDGPSFDIEPLSIPMVPTADSITAPLPSLHDHFTIQFWIEPKTSSSRQTIFQLSSMNEAKDLGWSILLELNSQLKLVCSLEKITGETRDVQKLEGPTLQELKWSRIELATCGSLVAFHLNGELKNYERFSNKLNWTNVGPSTLVLGGESLSGRLTSVKLWDSPMYLEQYFKESVFHDVHNSYEATTRKPQSFEEMVQIATEEIELPPLAKTLASMTTVNHGTSFPSLRPKDIFITSHAKVYYEMTLLDGNANQLGWSFGDCSFTVISPSVTGVGDVDYTYAIDLNRMVLWHIDKEDIETTPWTAGDVVGFLLDTEAGEMTFSLNGKLLENIAFRREENDDWFAHGPIYPSAAFSINCGAIWNFGHTPFNNLPEGYQSVLEASGALAVSPVTFELFDFERKTWYELSMWYRVQPYLRPSLLGSWPSENESNEAAVVDISYSNLSVIPIDSLAVSTLAQNAQPLPLDLPRGTFAHEYAELVRYINQLVSSRGWSRDDLLSKTWEEVAPKNEEELVKWPLLNQANKSSVTLQTRFEALKAVNQAIRTHLMMYIDVEYNPSYTSTLLSKLMASRDYIFGVVKQELWDREVNSTSNYGASKTLVLNRPKASRFLESAPPNTLNPFALFIQAYQGLKMYKPAEYCSSTRLYTVTFLGENAIDAGGPYRETFSQFAAELQSSQLPLLLPTPNNHHNVGNNRDAFVLHPSANQSQRNIQLMIFFGKLLGVAIRTKEYLDLNLSQVVWKLLAHEPLVIEDLEAVDSLVVSSMRSIRHIDNDGITEELFEDVIQETFTTLSTDNRTVPIVPNGESITVTFENRHEFADKVEQFRLHEYDEVAAYLRQGLGLVVPLQILRLFSWREVEMMVCGSPSIDVDLLCECTEYSCCEPTDPHVIWFWEVLREFSEESRRMFLKFVWGRIRLPRSKNEFGQYFKLQNNAREPADTYLPVSHTCFFSLELPRYSTKNILSKRLMYAIYNCQAIDGDGDALAANQLGWED